MKKNNYNRKLRHYHRHKRVLRQLRQGCEHLRLRIIKTNAHIYAQLLDDQNHKTILSASSLQLKLPNGNITHAKLVAEDLVRKMAKAQINTVSFDRGWSRYHGRIAAIAEVLRANNIKV